MPVDRSNPLPLWAQVLGDLRARLTAGEFNDRFPTDNELTQHYGVSRHTVREAVRRLGDEGLLERTRGRGTQLRDTPFEQSLGSLYSLFRSIEAQGARQSSIVLALETRRSPEAASRLGMGERVEFVYLKRIRLADDEPLAVDEVWLPLAVAKPLLETKFAHTALYDELDVRCGVRVTSCSERIAVALPDPQTRRVLGLGRLVGVFDIERVGLAAGEPIEWRHTVIRGDRLAFTAEWRESASSPLFTLSVAG